MSPAETTRPRHPRAARRARGPGLVRPRASTPVVADSDEWVGLRGLLPYLAGDAVEQAPLVFHAIGLAEWLFATRHCPRCGGRLEPRIGGSRAGVRRVPPPAVPAHRPGRDHGDHPRRAGLRRRGAPARSPGRPGRPVATPRWPGSSSRERRSRTPYAARSPRRPASRWARSTYFGNQPWPLPASLMLGFVGRAVVRHDRRRRSRDPGRALVHPREQMQERGRGRHARAPRRRLDLRSLVEDWYGGPLPGSW